MESRNMVLMNLICRAGIEVQRQRNIQQVKEHDKCPPNQTQEEEIWSLPEKEFRIMIVKMIQNLETKWSYR